MPSCNGSLFGELTRSNVKTQAYCTGQSDHDSEYRQKFIENQIKKKRKKIRVLSTHLSLVVPGNHNI